MTTWTDKQRSDMAADLCERVARSIREGYSHVTTDEVLRLATELRTTEEPNRIYARALMICGVWQDDNIRAAVAVILEGKHPPDSLAGRLEAYRGKASREALAQYGGFRANYCEGEVHAVVSVLDWIGCAPKETP